jgi:formylglycine-generating enzyme required for sulfatase activity
MLEVVLVKAGKFTTNDEGYSHDFYTHGVEVTLTQDFYIGRYPVTQAQYEAVMGNNPSHFSGNPNNPVEMVDWQNAKDFCDAVGGFLPTEAQWEFAARGGNLSQGYRFSGSDSPSEVAWFLNNSSNSTQPVGQKKPNELGIYDMSGNVNEWCADLADFFGTSKDFPSSNIDPTGSTTGSQHIIRGGDYRIGYMGQLVISGMRGGVDDAQNYVGFRVAFPAE